MQHPDGELLAGVALGEEVDAGLSAHVAQCPACTGEVAGLADVADALRADAPLLAPPPRVWDAVRAQVSQAVPSLTGRPTTTAAPSMDGPAAGGIPRRSVIGWLAAAAAAGAAAGAGATWLLTRPDAVPEPEARVELTTLDTRQVLGEASVRATGQGVTLSVRTQPLDPGEGYLEVWLINRDLARMVSVGVLVPGAPQHLFPIARRLLEEGYVVVDISREALDDRPEHSGDSLVRGELPL